MKRLSCTLAALMLAGAILFPCCSETAYAAEPNAPIILLETGDVMIENDLKLTEDMTVNGNLTLQKGSLDLAGFSLTVNGDFLQPKGAVYLNKGTLKVAGDYRIQGDNDTASDGILRMTYDEDTVIVGGNFITQSSRTSGNTASSNYFNKGTLSVGGDFKQLSSTANFAATNTHTTIFNGSEAQAVSFESNTATLANWKIEEGADVTITGLFSAGKLVGDSEAKSSGGILRGMDANGHSLTIIGDLEAIGSISLTDGELTIDGNLQQTNGRIDVNGGKLTVTGDYRIQGDDETASDGILRMTKDKDTVIVGGSFITQSSCPSGNTVSSNYFNRGTMYVGGDFKQLSNVSNFAASGSHTTIFNGGGKAQAVSFENNSAALANWKIEEGSDVTITGLFSAGKLVGDSEAKSSGGILRGMDANGHSLTVTGDLKAIGSISLTDGELTIDGDLQQTNGRIDVNGGKLTVTGDYRIQGDDETASDGILRMTEAEDTVIVGGSFITQSSRTSGNSVSSNYFNKGTMYVGGDFKQLSSTANFTASGTHTTIFNGGGKAQAVSFENSNATLANWKIEEGSDVTITGLFSAGKLVGDSEAKSSGGILRGMDANGHSLTITGDLEAIGSISLTNGELTVNGDLQQTNGSMVINGGKLTVTGDYRIQGDNDTASDGILRMSEAKDTVIVGGSFITQSSRTSGNTVSSNYFNRGTMYVGGDFKQLSSTANFIADNAHTTIFNGGGKAQAVSFENNSAALANWKIEEGSDVTITGLFSAGKLVGDSEAKSSGGILRGMDANGHSLTITGDLEAIGSISLTNGELTVNGDLQQTNGSMVINGGKLTVTGDYRIQGDNDTASDGILRMTEAEDTVIVGGNFITQSSRTTSNSVSSNYLNKGTMYVAGDFTQLTNTNNFYASGSHTLILNGTEHQTSTFTSASSRYNILQLEQDRSQYTFLPAMRCWDTLVKATDTWEPSGLCGGNLNWSLDKTSGLLSITGTGEMYNFTQTASPLWNEYADLITGISIGEGCTSIADYAFDDCSKLTEIHFLGAAPDISSTAFTDVTATIYYPADKEGWDTFSFDNYGGNPTWESMDPISVTGVTLSREEVWLYVGEDFRLYATVSPTNASDPSVTWNSADPSVASVSSTGLVTAVSEGQTIITVTTNDGAFTDICAIYVTDPGGSGGGSNPDPDDPDPDTPNPDNPDPDDPDPDNPNPDDPDPDNPNPDNPDPDDPNPDEPQPPVLPDIPVIESTPTDKGSELKLTLDSSLNVSTEPYVYLIAAVYENGASGRMVSCDLNTITWEDLANGTATILVPALTETQEGRLFLLYPFTLTPVTQWVPFS